MKGWQKIVQAFLAAASSSAEYDVVHVVPYQSGKSAANQLALRRRDVPGDTAT